LGEPRKGEPIFNRTLEQCAAEGLVARRRILNQAERPAARLAQRLRAQAAA
jgi:hypothetical protein